MIPFVLVAVVMIVPPGPGFARTQGRVNNLSNPKMQVFFTGLLSQFGPSVAALAVHGLVFAGLTVLWLALVARASAGPRRPAVRRTLDVASGIVLVAFGLRLAGEHG